jgi:histidinol-phosphate aminotransferase
MFRLAESHLLSLQPYMPGRFVGNSKKIPLWAKLASNENCLGPSPAAIEAAKDSLSKINLYPNAKRCDVILKICHHLKKFSVKKKHIALGNGTSELIVNLVRGLIGPDEVILYGWPTFIMYKQAAKVNARKDVAVPLKLNMSYDVNGIVAKVANKPNFIKLIFLANPNNPTGTYLNQDELNYLIKEISKDVIVVIDEAYFEYVTQKDYANGLIYALSRPRTIVLRTFSKAYGLAGLRLGYAIGDPNIIDILCRVRDPFNVNSVVQSAAIAALEDYEHVNRSVEHNILHMPKLAKGLLDFGFSVQVGAGNFLMAKAEIWMPQGVNLCEKLWSFGVIIRPLHPYGLNDWVRISVGTNDEISLLFKALHKVLTKQ